MALLGVVGHYDASKKKRGLGFRGMEIFNLALSFCQACRMWQETFFLSARILKAAYFPEASLFEAEHISLKSGEQF